MNREQFSKALKELHAPVERQKKLADAVGEKYGSGSRQYKQEFAKYASMLLAISPKEHELWCKFTAFLFEEQIAKGERTKESALKMIQELGAGSPDDDKPAWREAYKKIKAL